MVKDIKISVKNPTIRIPKEFIDKNVDSPYRKKLNAKVFFDENKLSAFTLVIQKPIESKEV